MRLMSQMPIEFLGTVSIYLGIGLQVAMALFLGGMVGYDREKKLKSAGLKTNILICLGATLYTSIGLLVAAASTGPADPSRMAAQIVSGIGFLGAGAIIQGRGNVIGMTTAATIWVVAAIGFTIGAGYPFSALFFSVTVLLVLKVINPLYAFMEKESENTYYQLEVLSKGSIERTVVGIIQGESVEIDEVCEEVWDEKKSKHFLTAFVTAHHRQMERILSDLRSSIKVEKAVYYGVTKQIKRGLHTIKADKSSSGYRSS